MRGVEDVADEAAYSPFLCNAEEDLGKETGLDRACRRRERREPDPQAVKFTYRPLAVS